MPFGNLTRYYPLCSRALPGALALPLNEAPRAHLDKARQALDEMTPVAATCKIASRRLRRRQRAARRCIEHTITDYKWGDAMRYFCNRQRPADAMRTARRDGQAVAESCAGFQTTPTPPAVPIARSYAWYLDTEPQRQGKRSAELIHSAFDGFI